MGTLNAVTQRVAKQCETVKVSNRRLIDRDSERLEVIGMERKKQSAVRKANTKVKLIQREMKSHQRKIRGVYPEGRSLRMNAACCAGPTAGQIHRKRWGWRGSRLETGNIFLKSGDT